VLFRAGMNPSPFLVVVRSDRPDLVEDLSSTFRDIPAIVILDRRHRERRVIVQDMPVERRSGQRRALPDEMWRRLGFIVTETEATDAAVANA
jgi:hypothetical protein